MILPSIKETHTDSEEKLTAATRSSAERAKIPTPSLQKSLFVFFRLYSIDFNCAKAKIPGERNRPQPKLGGEIFTVNMYVEWLVRFVAEEVEPIGARSENRGHGAILSNQVIDSTSEVWKRAYSQRRLGGARTRTAGPVSRAGGDSGGPIPNGQVVGHGGRRRHGTAHLDRVLPDSLRWRKIR